MADRVVIRRARVKDAAAAAAYMTALKSEPGLDTVGSRPAPSVEEERIRLRKALGAERAFVLLAWDGENLIGMLDVWAGERPDVRHAGQLGISVARDWRGRGVGRALMVEAISRAQGWDGFCRIELEVAAWNPPAIALYQSLGFQLEGTKRKALLRGGELRDLLIMARVW